MDLVTHDNERIIYIEDKKELTLNELITERYKFESEWKNPLLLVEMIRTRIQDLLINK